MAFIRCEVQDNPGVALFIINGFQYDFRQDDVISFSDVGGPYVDYKVESVKVQINRVDSSDPGGSATSVWGAATVLITVSVVP